MGGLNTDLGAGRRELERAFLPPRNFVGFAIAVFAVLVIFAVSYRSLHERQQTSALVLHTFAANEQLEMALSALKDAETGQRGFLLTGSESYLEPYERARAELPERLTKLRSMARTEQDQLQRIGALERVVEDKLRELGETVALKRAGDSEGALTLVRTGRGKGAMDHARSLANELRSQHQRALERNQAASNAAAAFANASTWGGCGLLLGLIFIAAAINARDYRAQQTEAWLRSAQLQLGQELQGDRDLEGVGDKALAFVAAYLDASVASFLVAEGSVLRRIAAYAGTPPKEATSPFGQGIAGQAAKERRALVIHDVPSEHLAVTSATGTSRARSLVVVPALVDGGVQAVIELGLFRAPTAADLELLSRTAQVIATAIRTAKDRDRVNALLEQTQRQAELLQQQQEELLANNEELEQQSEALRHQQADLENQQTELEQTNVALEEHAQLLATQKADIIAAKDELAVRARDLSAASRYKSEFLANMSHELRTPLNSALILAKLLSDNRDGNLKPEQVKFAQSIYSAGNDLLELINDILDLSKIEAGMLEVRPDPLRLARVADGLLEVFQPIAHEKQLTLELHIDPDVPEMFFTDAQRLRQILKNLLSNAIKFTDQGRVSLSIRRGSNGLLLFEVKDTGIGIDASQHALVFEAFKQGDGGANRKYGGTGLGLSISRDLARLLGGDLSLASSLGGGSTFTLALPNAREAASPAVISEHARMRPFEDTPARTSNVPPARTFEAFDVPDDRAALQASARVLLIVEDDPLFAKLLLDMAHELDYQAIVTPSADEAVQFAAQYEPSAIVLDMHLPDHSGLTVLDRLKRAPATRHIPVQVVSSVSDTMQPALEMGAAGYMLKPVDREKLIEALHRLEQKVSRPVRSVLVVEDDDRQRESICHLLRSSEVTTHPVGNSAQALQELKNATHDCMVLDLTLPDGSGFDLLATMAEDDAYSFPPVIIYTGRALSSEEEARLHRYSRSIIIKGARSPERLLDEVTLFLHRIEKKLPIDQQRMLKESRSREKAFDGRKILIAEDDVRNVFALSNVLEPRGANVVIARNGREALTLLDKHPDVDLVLMDVMMPEMDGLEATRRIREQAHFARLPIIAITAKAMRDDQKSCLDAGANDYIAKPIDVDKLISLIRVWLPK